MQLPLVAARAINSGSIARVRAFSRLARYAKYANKPSAIAQLPVCVEALRGALSVTWLASYASYAPTPPTLSLPLSLPLFRTLYTWTMLEINVINARKCSNSVIS